MLFLSRFILPILPYVYGFPCHPQVLYRSKAVPQYEDYAISISDPWNIIAKYLIVF